MAVIRSALRPLVLGAPLFFVVGALTGCADEGDDDLEILRAEPLASAIIEGYEPFSRQDHRNYPLSGLGDVASVAIRTKWVVDVGDLDTAIEQLLDQATETGWTIEPDDDQVTVTQLAGYSGTKDFGFEACGTSLCRARFRIEANDDRVELDSVDQVLIDLNVHM